MLRHIGLIALAASVVAGVSAAQAAVIAPYSNDFSASVDDFVASTAGGGWILDTDASTYSHTTTTGARYTAALEVSNLGGADTIDFAITGKLVQSSATGTGTYVSLVALAPTSSFGGAALDGYTLRWRASSTFNTDCIELL